MRTARENVLIHGLFDWVSLASVHSDVMRDNPGAADEVLQNEAVTLIRSLVSEGLFEVGNVFRNEGFVPWNTPFDESMQRIYDMYVTHYDDKDGWRWGCWLRLTEKGLPVARTAEDISEDSSG